MNGGSNLPPGCRESDIPGNRPEDVVFDRWWDKIDTYWKDYLDDEVLDEDVVELKEKYGDNGGDAYDEYHPFKAYADKILEDMKDPDYGKPDRWGDE